MFNIRMGIPEMEALWNKLQTGHRNGKNSKKDEELYMKWGSALKKLSVDPMYPSFHTHEIEPHPEDAKNGAYDRINLSELP